MSEAEIAPINRVRTIEFDLQLVRELFLAGWIPSAIVFITVLALCAAVLLVVPAQYSAQTVLLMQPQADSVADKSTPAATPELVRSQLDVIQSRPVLEAAVQRLSLDADPEFAGRSRAGSPKAVSGAVERLSRRLSVDNDGRSFVIRLQVRSRDAQKAAKIANVIAQEYVALQRAQKVRSVKSITQRLSDRIDELRRRAEVAEAAAENFRRASNLVLLSAAPDATAADGGGTATSREALEAARQKAEFDAQRAQANARLEVQQAQIEAGAGAGTNEVIASPLISRLREQEQELSRTEAQLRAKYKPDHPLLAPVLAQLAEVRRQIAAETTRVHAAVRAQSEAARRSDQLLNGVVSDLNRRVDREITATAKLRELQSEAHIQRNLYEEFAAQAGRAAERIDLQVPDIVIVSPASTPLSPVSPNKPVVFVAALALGLMGAGAASVVNSLARPGLLGPADAQRITGLPVVWAAAPGQAKPNAISPLTRVERADLMRLTARALSRSVGVRPVILGVARAEGSSPSVFAGRWALELHRAGASVLLVADSFQPNLSASADPPLRMRRAAELVSIVERDPTFTSLRAELATDFEQSDFVVFETGVDNLLLPAIGSGLDFHSYVMMLDTDVSTRLEAKRTVQALHDFGIIPDGLVLV